MEANATRMPKDSVGVSKLEVEHTVYEIHGRSGVSTTGRIFQNADRCMKNLIHNATSKRGDGMLLIR